MGILGVVELDADVTRGTITESIPAALDADGKPVVTTFPLE
jgi:hypothetical protein